MFSLVEMNLPLYVDEALKKVVDDGDTCLEGLVPVVEGWLTKVCLLGVSASYIKLY